MLSMLKRKQISKFFTTALFSFGYYSVLGDEPFESLNVRLNCYKDQQKGCSNELTEAYPEYAWSYNNLTRATTHFYLFTKDNVDEPELLHKCAADVPPKTNFNPFCRTEIFIPGFVSGICNFAIYRELKNERLKCGCFNVVLVDWMWGNIFDLVESKENLKIVAQHVVILIRNLKRRYGLGEDAFIVTGHSYGAHGAGFVGQEEPVGIINGIEPAGVLFTENTPLDERLDPGDAKCVHVTHCSAGQCLPDYFGVNFTCGTVDFYFNGGLTQPLCYTHALEAFAKGDLIFGLFSLFPAACNHFMCLQYYKISMCPTDNCQFVGTECCKDAYFQRGLCGCCADRTYALTGAYACDCLSWRNVGKKYYLNTTPNCPFCDESRPESEGYFCPAAACQSVNRNY